MICKFCGTEVSFMDNWHSFVCKSLRSGCTRTPFFPSIQRRCYWQFPNTISQESGRATVGTIMFVGLILLVLILFMMCGMLFPLIGS